LRQVIAAHASAIEIPIAATDYYAGPAAFNIACVRNIGLAIQAAAATPNIYGYLVATAVTSPGTTTVYLTVDFMDMD
jgi:hypothetical protein